MSNLQKKKPSLMTNAIVYTIKVTAGAILPLIMYKIGAGALKVEGMGEIEYNRSLVNYFSLVAAFGINTYAIREGARIRENKIDIDNFASEVFSINLLTASISTVALLILTKFVPQINANFYIIVVFGSSLLLTAFGVEWLFNIYEQFIYITVRSLAFNAIAVLLMILFVRNNNDIVQYCIFYVIGLYGSNVLNYLFSKKYVKLKAVYTKKMYKHIKPMSYLFFNNLATTIYVNSDSTMLGKMVGNHSLGLYSVSVKVYNAFKLITQSVLSIALPRLSFYSGKDNKEDYNNLQCEVLRIVMAIVYPCILLIVLLRNELILLLSNNEFLRANTSLLILAIALFFSTLGMITGSTILIPLRREKKIFISTSIGAVINIVLNFFVIPKYHEVGAAATTAIAEAVVTSCEIFFARDIISKSFNKYLKSDLLSEAIGVFAVVMTYKFLGTILPSTIIGLIIKALIIIGLYGVVLLILGNKVMLALANKIMTIIKKRQ